MSMVVAQCVSCKWWRQEDGLETGRCHRFPPMLIEDRLQIATHPVTLKEMWCGEFVHAKPDCAGMSIEQLYRLIPSNIGRYPLEDAGIKNVGQLIARTPDELLSLRQFGEKALTNVRNGLSQLGVALKGDD